MQNLAQEYKAANEKLEAHADDPDANLAVGRFLCFQKDDWKSGAPYLARGGDETLKTLAALEAAIASRAPGATGAGRRLVGGCRKAGRQKEPARSNRCMPAANYWYREALPGLTRLGMQEKRAKTRQPMNRRAEIGIGENRSFSTIFQNKMCRWALACLANMVRRAFPADQIRKEVQCFAGAPTAKHALLMQPVPAMVVAKASFVIDHKFHNFTPMVGFLEGSTILDQPRDASKYAAGDGQDCFGRSRPIRHSRDESQECSVVRCRTSRCLQLMVYCSGKDRISCRAAWVNPLLKK